MKTRIIGILGLLVIFLGGSYLLLYSLPYVISLAANTLSTAVIYIILFALLYLIFILFRMAILGR